jgi:hypothetical protein
MLNDTDLWRYNKSATTQGTQLKGFDVEATDGHIGHVDDATEEVAGSYIVVDTGPWIFGRKVVLPAGTIERIDLDNKKVHVGMTKDQIKKSPEYDPDKYGPNSTEWDDYRGRLGAYYVGIYRTR